ncbi:MAG: chromosome segregation protein SMC [Candidatus Methylacidiphilales bacterium]|nr:chromosome segregation protein SMC [Candidatus Methylacidiphilales bacterium]
MYLKALHVVGFKSFADKTTLHFHRGVTAIVGPNGCGKSNVLDSIRWVLGEQSAKALRGGAMQDVIFNGTDMRKPLAMGEVALTFGDCEGLLGIDFNEVTITRRVYRDGGSEYELNKQPCRLRDIHQLFMDTGIGRTAYSIMEQGKIDQILSSRPEDRRAIFEEAAGITKYKSQKKEALRKLETTDANLIRVEDIIREVKRQIGSLQRQAGKARRYQETRAELTMLDNKLARKQFDELSTELNALNADVDGARSEFIRLTLDVEKNEKLVKETRERQAELDGQLMAARQEVNDHKSALDRATQKREVSRSRVEEYGETAEKRRSEAASTMEKAATQAQQVTRLKAQLEKSIAGRKELERELAEAEESGQILRSRIAELERERGEQERRRTSAERQIGTVRSQLSALEVQQKNFSFRMESLQAEQNALTAQREEILRQSAIQGDSLRSVEEQVEERQQQLQDIRAEESAHVTETREIEQRVQTLQRNCQAKQARLEALRLVESSQAGAPSAVQDVVQAASSGALSEDVAAKILGALSSHLRVAAGFETPIALLLGDALQALVVRDRTGLDAVLQRVAASKSRQCVLAPLDLPRNQSLTASYPSAQADTSAQGVVSARSKVEASQDVASLLDALLFESYIAPDLPTALQFRSAHSIAAISTFTRELLTREGVVHIGRVDDNSVAVLHRQTELRQLEAEVGPLQSELSALQTDREALLERGQTFRARLAEAQAALQEVQIQVATQKHSHRAQVTQAEELARKLELTARELARISAQDKQDYEQHAGFLATIRKMEEDLDDADREIESLSQQRAATSEEESEHTQSLTSLSIQVATQQQQAEGLRQQIAPVEQRMMELEETAERRLAEAADYEARAGMASEDIVTSEFHLRQHSESLARSEEAAIAIWDRRTEIQTEIDAIEAHLRTTRRTLNEVHGSRAQQEVQLGAKQNLLTNLRERMRRDYQMELENLPELTEADATNDWHTMEIDAREKRAALESMGPVNIEAIAEYDELEKRNQFLDSQYNDLSTAKAQILEALTEINITTSKLFAETFEKVKINFQDMFTDLFGGGKAVLNLIDDKDPLECGIEIVARPPGKQPQSISLLSGGEKTMTAVALLFAIYLVKPSPFCVLDEMDAPLDESNINRFIKILQRFVHQSQFVVITHNKRTISVADAIYGVTMEEHGVSKLVSVKLSRRDGTEVAAVPLKPGAEDLRTVMEAATTVSVNGAETDESTAPSIAESFGKSGNLGRG